MQIVHFSDTHLGFSDFDIVNSDNINQREMDFYDAFSQVVEQIKEIKPDYIIHTGDLFHRVSPSNRAIAFALEKFKIIDSLNIPTILIAGNHSTPKTNTSTPILKIFENFDNIYAAYNQAYEKFEFDDVVFHCLPHIYDNEKMLSEIERVENSIQKDKKNILMMHCSVGASYLMHEFGEWVYPSEKEYLFSKMDYVALGHWHGFGRVGNYNNVYYSGSTERTMLNDTRESKGFALVSIKDDINVEYREIKTRRIKKFSIDCSRFDEEIKALDLSDIKDTICHVTLTNLTISKSIEISNSQIRDIFKDALYTHIKREIIGSKDFTQISGNEAHTLSLQEYFLDHIKESYNGDRLEEINKKVKDLFFTYEEQYRDTEES